MDRLLAMSGRAEQEEAEEAEGGALCLTLFASYPGQRGWTQKEEDPRNRPNTPGTTEGRDELNEQAR